MIITFRKQRGSIKLYNAVLEYSVLNKILIAIVIQSLKRAENKFDTLNVNDINLKIYKK